MEDVCLDFKDLGTCGKNFNQYLDKKEVISDQLWYAVNAAYSKLTNYYTKLRSENFANATMLDPRSKLIVYDTTQDAVALKASAALGTKLAFNGNSILTALPPQRNPSE